MRQVLQSVTILLQSVTVITKYDDYYKVRQYKRLLTTFFNRHGPIIGKYGTTLRELKTAVME